MDRITKQYGNGNWTLDASKFPPIDQNVLDSEIRNSKPIRAAVERLAELEDKQTPKGVIEESDNFFIWKVCPNCQNTDISDEDNIIFDYCPHCGQRLGA